MCPMRLSSRQKPTTSWYWNYRARATSTVLRDVSWCFQRIGEPQLPKKTGEMCHSSDSCRENKRKMTQGHGIGGVKCGKRGHLHRHSKGLDDTSIASTSAGVPRRTQTPRIISRGLGIPHHLVIKNRNDRSPKLKCLFMGTFRLPERMSKFWKNILEYTEIFSHLNHHFAWWNHFNHLLESLRLPLWLAPIPREDESCFLRASGTHLFFGKGRQYLSVCILICPKLRIFMDFSFSLPNI